MACWSKGRGPGSSHGRLRRCDLRQRIADVYDERTNAVRPRQVELLHELADCSCPDLYCCPTSREVECAKHGGFSVCCNRPDEHVTVPHELKKGFESTEVVYEPGGPIPLTG
jgi:hypothetical protein